MFPQADVPVAVVSLDARMDAAMHVAIGRALRGLDDEGVLVLASGSITHNLREVSGEGRPIGAPAEPYAREFADWIGARVAAGVGDAGEVLHQSFTFGVIGMHACGLARTRAA
jgi:4,5-DOPA dioxygenase extradiol